MKLEHSIRSVKFKFSEDLSHAFDLDVKARNLYRRKGQFSDDFCG